MAMYKISGLQISERYILYICTRNTNARLYTRRKGNDSGRNTCGAEGKRQKKKSAQSDNIPIGKCDLRNPGGF